MDVSWKEEGSAMGIRVFVLWDYKEEHCYNISLGPSVSISLWESIRGVHY